MGSYDQRQERIRGAIHRFERFPGDTGSSEVQGNLLCPLKVPIMFQASPSYKYVKTVAAVIEDLVCLSSQWPY